MTHSAQPSEWLPDGVSDDRVAAAADLGVELVKEQLFRRLSGELPYELEPVPTEARTFAANGAVLLKQTIFVRSESVSRTMVRLAACPRPPTSLCRCDAFKAHTTVQPAGAMPSTAESTEHRQHVCWSKPNMGSDEPVAMLQVRAIVVGRNGEVIGQVGIAARQALQRALDTPVHLYVSVVVRKPGGSDTSQLMAQRGA